MYKFPEDLYVDVRIEEVTEASITFTNEEMIESKIKMYKGAFIRVFDGNLWYYTSTSDVNNIQKYIDDTTAMATPNPHIYNHPIVKRFEVNQGDFMKFQDNDISKISKNEKIKVLKSYFPVLKSHSMLKMCKSYYRDKKVTKKFLSSKGANLKWDFQLTGLRYFLSFSNGQESITEVFDKATNYFSELFDLENGLKDCIRKCEDYVQNARNISPGEYTVILSPEAAGVFAHESFGHKSEADNMLGDENMKNEWKIGKRIGSECLSIIDDGNILGRGFLQFDDEGTKVGKTYLIKNGILTSRLHSATTAGYFDEELTGNSRALSFEYEPIVRMTSTYIESGNKTTEELFCEVEEGVYIETINHGQGMATFSIGPSLAYYIKDGKIAYPVKISVITGNVFKTLYEIDGISKDIEIRSSVLGGCGKMEQMNLDTSDGGPYVRVKKLYVQ